MTGIPTALDSALAEHYRIEHDLGQAGMARVYLGRSTIRDDRDWVDGQVSSGIGRRGKLLEESKERFRN